MRAYLPLKRRSNIANPKVAITRKPARTSPTGSSRRQKIVFVYGIRNTKFTEFGYRITDLGSRISSGCRMPKTPRPRSTPHGIPCRWAVGVFCFRNAELLRNSDIGYNITDIGDIRMSAFSRPGFIPHGISPQLLRRAGGLAGWRAGGMRKLERMLFLRVPKGTTDSTFDLQNGT